MAAEYGEVMRVNAKSSSGPSTPHRGTSRHSCFAQDDAISLVVVLRLRTCGASLRMTR